MSLQTYIDSIAGYQKNQYPLLPRELRQRISQEWRTTIEKWDIGREAQMLFWQTRAKSSTQRVA